MKKRVIALSGFAASPIPETKRRREANSASVAHGGTVRGARVRLSARIASLLLAVCLLFSLSVPALAAGSLSNFEKTRTYKNTFSDVSGDSWRFSAVSGAYEYGFMEGKGAGLFDPDGSLTIAEAIKLAVMLYRGYHFYPPFFDVGEPWYDPYVTFALENVLITGTYKNYDAAATRADFAVILAGALPAEALTPINKIADGAIPDVWEYYSYGPAVYRLYRAGILSGSDETGTFYPGRTITRAEAAAIVLRMLDANSRVALRLAPALTAEEVYKLAAPAVFYVEVFDRDGDIEKTGSGFFISESGLAVTNHHVINGATKAQITTDSGEVYEVTGVYDYDWEKDIALIQIDGEDFPCLSLADSGSLSAGATVYALGSPLGLQSTFSKGIISNTYREMDGTEYIQTDAPISSGSSGGALLDSYGRVVGVTTATAMGAQNINLAVPINIIGGLDRSEHVELSSILPETEFYDGFRPVPDFGAYAGISLYSENVSGRNASYSYRMRDLPKGDELDELIKGYERLLEQNFFTYFGEFTRDGNIIPAYYHRKYGIFIMFGAERVGQASCFSVHIS